MLTVCGYIEGRFGLRYPYIRPASHDAIGRTRAKWSRSKILACDDVYCDDEPGPETLDRCECHPIGHKYPLGYFNYLNRTEPAICVERGKQRAKRKRVTTERMIKNSQCRETTELHWEIKEDQRFVRKKDSPNGKIDETLMPLIGWYLAGDFFGEKRFGLVNDPNNNQWVLYVPVLVKKKIKYKEYYCLGCGDLVAVYSGNLKVTSAGDQHRNGERQSCGDIPEE